MRNNIILGNNETGERIYLTSKNKRNTPDRLQLKKYSPKLRKRVVFTEVKYLFNDFISLYRLLSVFIIGGTRYFFVFLRLLMSHHWHNIIVNMSKLLGWPFFNMLKLLIVSV